MLQTEPERNFDLACTQAFSQVGWGEGKAPRSLPFPRYFSQTESLFTGYFDHVL